MQKRKNDMPHHPQRKLLIAVMIFGALVLVCLSITFIACTNCGRIDDPEDPTWNMTAIEATGNAMADQFADTRDAQTRIAETQMP